MSGYSGKSVRRIWAFRRGSSGAILTDDTQIHHIGEGRCLWLIWVPACEVVRKSCGQTNPSSPRKRGPRGKGLKSLGSRFRGNDEQRMLGVGLRDWITPCCAGMTRTGGVLPVSNVRFAPVG